MDVAAAIRHLRSRVAHIDGMESRHRPHWTQADLDAVASLVDIPASAEQIALARIEGRAQAKTAFSSVSREQIDEIRAIAGKALGLE